MTTSRCHWSSDDILVNFDNARALAALKALAELSTRTQVLFFTHHEHSSTSPGRSWATRSCSSTT